jgi:hypothetical protein
MDNMVGKVQVETTMSELSKITDGLKQGDGLAPLNLIMEYVMRKVTGDRNATL